MVLEKPNILQVKDNVVRVSVPYHIFDDVTYLNKPLSAGGTTINVLDNTNISDNDFLVLGNIGDDKCEIVKVNGAPTRGTTITLDSSVFDHGIDEPVRIIRYDQVSVYKSSTSDDASPTIIGSAATIDVAQGYNIFNIATADQDSYYYARFTNSDTATNSEYSTSVASSGYTRSSVQKIIQTALKRTQSRAQDDEVINNEYLVDCFNEWQEWVFEDKRDWSFLRAAPSITELRRHTQEYALPSDIQDASLGQSVIAITLMDRGCKLKYKDPEYFFEVIMKGVPKSKLAAQITTGSTSATLDNSGDFEDTGTLYIGGDELDYTANSKSTKTISGMDNPSTTHAVDTEVYGNVSEGLPEYFTVLEGKLFIWPLVSDENEYESMRLFYWKNFTNIDEINDSTIIPFKRSAVNYIMAKIEEAKGDPNNKADKFMAIASSSKRAALQKELSQRHNVMTTYSKSNIYG